jgi:hypothetical protein
VKAFRSDNGREYINEELISQFREMGIRYETMVAGNLQTNGCAERFNQIVLCKVGSMLKQSGFPVTLSAEIASTAVFLHNMTPKLLNKNIPPYTAIFDKQLWAKRLVIVGTLVIARRQYNGKLTAREKEVYMVGYSKNKFGLRLYDPNFQTVNVYQDFRVHNKSNFKINCQNKYTDKDDRELASFIHNEPSLDSNMVVMMSNVLSFNETEKALRGDALVQWLPAIRA